MKINFKVLSAILILFLLFLLPTPNSQLSTIFAQTPCGTSGLQKATGLVSTPKITTGSFVTSSGACVVDPRAGFAPFKIPGYDDLKSLYYDQSKASKDSTTFTPTKNITKATTFTGDKVYYDSGDLTVSGTPTGSGTPVIFVNGNLNFTSTGNYCYGALNCLPTTPVAATVGTMFVVRGNVNIDPTVTRIDAIIISSGTIYTAGANCSLATNTGINSQLVINGSLISLTDTASPKFCRTLDPAAAINNNNSPAEKINHQVKYLVILRNLMSDTLQRWSEIP